MLGIRGAYDAIKTANGPAQHFLLAGWGFVVAFMFWDMGVPNALLTAWAFTSIFIFVATVWLPKIFLQYILLIDCFLSVAVLTFYLTYDPTPTSPVYYTMTATGMDMAHRSVNQAHGFDFLAHVLSGVFMATHALYLSNLVHRQRLEAKRFAA